jgi:hypothetical protein
MTMTSDRDRDKEDKDENDRRATRALGTRPSHDVRGDVTTDGAMRDDNDAATNASVVDPDSMGMEGEGEGGDDTRAEHDDGNDVHRDEGKFAGMVNTMVIVDDEFDGGEHGDGVASSSSYHDESERAARARRVPKCQVRYFPSYEKENLPRTPKLKRVYWGR